MYYNEQQYYKLIKIDFFNSFHLIILHFNSKLNLKQLLQCSVSFKIRAIQSLVSEPCLRLIRD